MKQRTEQALALAELEARNVALVQEQKERKRAGQTAPAQDSEIGVRAITEMHAALARQLEEVRRLTLQQQQQQQQQNQRVDTATPPPSQPQTSSNNPSDASELESLRAAKAQLESRLSSSKAQWMALLEQVERRCAELFTKNVMLTEDNENLRQHLTKARMKAPR